MKTRPITDDQPTMVPAEHSAVIFAPDGSATLFIPPRAPDKPIDAGGWQILRAAVLFGDGPESESARNFVDLIIDGSTP